MIPQFEEKQYEDLLKGALTSGTSLFTVGQVFEHEIGIDFAVFSRSSVFWNLWSQRMGQTAANKARKGLVPSPDLWGTLQKDIDSAAFPSFKCNLFIQVKRAEYMRGSRASEFWYWKGPYYRYYISPGQHRILRRLHDNIKARALVVYAAPAFHLWTELWEHRHAIVPNSSFATVPPLDGHDCYTYDKAWGVGRAFSEQEGVDEEAAIRQAGSRITEFSSATTNSAFIASLADSIREAMTEELGLDGLRTVDGESEQGLESHFALIEAFKLYTNTSWFILYSGEFRGHHT